MDKLYEIKFEEEFGNDIIRNMYYRSSRIICEEPGEGHMLWKKNNYDFFTYFNSLSLLKWRRYTRLNKFYLVIEAKGDFDLYVFGHQNFSRGKLPKQYYFKQHIISDVFKTIIISVPDNAKSDVIGFSICTNKNSYIKNAYWAANMENLECNLVNIALSTTTFKKERYIFKNSTLLRDGIFSDEKYSGHFHWFIVDNGQTLDQEYFDDDHITLVKNPNVGGAGGFARGMMESIRKGGFSHVLLMDDDVEMTIESFKRLFLLLSYLKKEYQDCFVSGAMLKMEEPNVQHEDIGVFDIDGRHHPAKPVLDLNIWDSIVKNESYMYTDGLHYYAGWWFCCIPVRYVREDNLPLPIFVRGDDVEFSLRNNPGFISMNGICIWHEGFEGKFSAALEFYQVERNELILVNTNDGLKDVDVLGRIERFFWEELYKFNYKGASLLLDSIEDYLRGPDYVFSLDGGQMMKDKKAVDNHPIPMSGEVKAIVPQNLYEWQPIKGRIKKLIYDYTYNGQARLPEFLFVGGGERLSVIPYGWGYFQNKMCFAKKIYAVDLWSNTYVCFTKDRSEFVRLKARHKELMERYQSVNAEVSLAYKKAFSEAVTFESWEKRTML